jgi:hypothetical protein
MRDPKAEAPGAQLRLTKQKGVRCAIHWTALAIASKLTSAFAQGTPEEAIPALKPPLDPIPPTFWDLYGVWVLVGAFLLLLLGAAIIWLIFRPRARIPIPPEVRARHELEPLRQEPESGAVLSRISQVVRSYFSAAFALPQAEMTTGEFCRAIRGRPDLGERLEEEVGTFLRTCDERKFAPAPPPEPIGAVARADKLIEAAEMRRAELRKAAEANQHAGGSTS